MAKRNTKMGMYQQKPAQPKRRSPAGKPTSKPARASGKPVSSTRPSSRAAQQTGREPAQVNLLTVRIIAIAVAAAAIIGGVAWAVDLQGSFGIGETAGLIGLAFIAGLGIFVAIRTPEVVTKVMQFRRSRE